jgi:hypothetical protein
VGLRVRAEPVFGSGASEREVAFGQPTNLRGRNPPGRPGVGWGLVDLERGALWCFGIAPGSVRCSFLLEGRAPSGDRPEGSGERVPGNRKRGGNRRASERDRAALRRCPGLRSRSRVGWTCREVLILRRGRLRELAKKEAGWRSDPLEFNLAARDEKHLRVRTGRRGSGGSEKAFGPDLTSSGEGERGGPSGSSLPDGTGDSGGTSRALVGRNKPTTASGGVSP